MNALAEMVGRHFHSRWQEVRGQWFACMAALYWRMGTGVNSLRRSQRSRMQVAHWQLFIVWYIAPLQPLVT